MVTRAPQARKIWGFWSVTILPPPFEFPGLRIRGGKMTTISIDGYMGDQTDVEHPKQRSGKLPLLIPIGN